MRISPLFPLKAPEGCANVYRRLVDPPNDRVARLRQQCEEMWRDFWDLADADFPKRLLPFEFHQRWFEMYLGAALRRAGLKVTAPKPGPDFQILSGGGRIHLEAVCATPGHPLQADSVPEPVYRDADGAPVAARVPHDQIALRIATVFRSKRDAFDRYRRDERVAADDLCVIAVNVRGIPHAWADAKEFLFRALYGVGNRYLVIDQATRRVVAAGREHRELLPRAGGTAAEEAAPLLAPERSDLSGVLGSSADCGNAPNLLGDDFVLMPHAAPRAPLPQGLIARGVEIRLHAREVDGSGWTVEEVDYGAPEPHDPEALSVEYKGEKFEGEWEIAGRELQVRVAGHGSAIPFRGGADPAAAAAEIALEMLRDYDEFSTRRRRATARRR